MRSRFTMGGIPHSNRAAAWYFYRYEYIIDHRGSAALVRWRRVLFWRSRHRWQRPWPDSVDLPDHLFGWRIPRLEKLTGKSRGRFSRRRRTILWFVMPETT